MGHSALPDVPQEMLKKDVGHQIHLPRGRSSLSKATLPIHMQRQLVKREDVHVEEGELLL